MEYLPAILIVFLISTIIAILWARAIANMHEKYPDYKGEDFLNWDRKNDDWDKLPTHSGRDGWDDNKIHSEGDF